MFNLRHKRTTRDREQGLVFEWRLPVGNTMHFITAGVVVAGIAAGLAATVRVRVGAAPRQAERRGSLVLVPQGGIWNELEWMAVEAGPRPRRADPAGEPAVKEALARGLAKATTPGYAYAPALRPVAVDHGAADLTWEETGDSAPPAVLPPLPELAPPSQNPPMPTPARVVVLSDGPLRATPPRNAPPATVTRGSRYLLRYDGEGRVIQATTLTAPVAPTGGTAPELTTDAAAWLLGVTLTGGAADGGWTAVEITGGL